MSREPARIGKFFVMVGMVGAGKTTRARQLASEHRAVRITPDEWVIPIHGSDFRNDEYSRRRDVIEGRLVSLALDILTAGADVVLDFGCWAKDERTALRWLAASRGAASELVYVPLEEDAQLERISARWQGAPHTNFDISDVDLAGWRDLFQVPDDAELQGGPLDPTPEGFEGWAEWAVERWPSLSV